MPLQDRMDFLARTLQAADNSHLEIVQSFVVTKAAVHRSIIQAGGEGSVWKRVDQPYQAGRRVKHWIKKKAGIEVEAFVSGFKTGNNGHTGMVGAVEFSARQVDGSSMPVAWVSSWTDDERRAMTMLEDGRVILNPSYLGRKGVIIGHNESARSHRIRHARLKQWAS